MVSSRTGSSVNCLSRRDRDCRRTPTRSEDGDQHRTSLEVVVQSISLYATDTMQMSISSSVQIIRRNDHRNGCPCLFFDFTRFTAPDDVQQHPRHMISVRNVTGIQWKSAKKLKQLRGMPIGQIQCRTF